MSAVTVSADIHALLQAADADAALALLGGDRVPAGAVMYFAAETPPTGWLKANGAAVSRTTYADLFAAIGTTFGSGDGSTTFELPDARGEFIRAWDDGRGVDSGRALGSYQSDEIRAHEHGHDVDLTDSNGQHNVTGATIPGGSGIVADSTGSAVQPHGGAETRGRNIAFLACIKF